MADPVAPIRVAAFYRFAAFADPPALRAPLLALAAANGVHGTVLLAGEGVNGTVAGPPAGVARVIDHLRALPGCAALEVKFADAQTLPFHRLKVRVKREIVTLGVDGLDPAGAAGTRVAPADWNALIAADDVVTIDTRNAYEVAIGSFAGAVDPGTRTFREFPAWFAANRAALAGKRVAMFCTGGIRCEKATALVRAAGVAHVHHLDGGILRYLEEMPEAQSLWRGDCFVFDERVAVTHGLAPGAHGLCRGCRMPVGAADRTSPLYEEGVACPRCHAARDAAQRAGAAERHRQVALAAARGGRHVGDAVIPGSSRDPETTGPSSV